MRICWRSLSITYNWLYLLFLFLFISLEKFVRSNGCSIWETGRKFENCFLLVIVQNLLRGTGGVNEKERITEEKRLCEWTKGSTKLVGCSRVCTVSVGREEEERLDVYIHGWIKVYSGGRRKGPFAVAVVLPAWGVTAKRSKVMGFCNSCRKGDGSNIGWQSEVNE